MSNDDEGKSDADRPDEGSDGDETVDALLDGENLSNFADRHRVPVNVIRELNPDAVDTNGDLVPGTASLRYE